MADNSFTRMGSLLASVPELQQAKDVRMTKAEQIAWRAAAGKDISDHTVIKADRGEWQITADSPVWGDAVRQRQAEILDALHRANIEIRALNIKVRPRHAAPKPATSDDENSGRSLDSKTASLLAQTADGLKSQDLAQAVKRLSRHGHRESD